MKKGRLLFICQHFYPEMVSTGLHMTELATSLVERGWDVDVVCAYPTRDVEDTEEAKPKMSYRGVDIHRVNTVGGHDKGFVWRFVLAMTYVFGAFIFAFRQADRYDHAIVTTNPPFVGVVGIAVSFLGKMDYTGIVYDVYPDFAIELDVVKKGSVVARLWEWITEAIFESASGLVVIGDDMRKVVESKLSHRNGNPVIRKICNWSDDSVVGPNVSTDGRLAEELGIRSKFVVHYGGNMGRTHLLVPFIKAAKKLECIDEMHWLFVGDGAKKVDLENAIDEYGLGNVTMLPFQPKERLSEVFGLADVSVVSLLDPWVGLSVPSKTYGIMASGTAVLAVLDPDSEIGKTVQQFNCGKVVHPGCPDAIAEAVREFHNNPQSTKRMGERGRKAFLENYTLSAAADQYDQFLSELIFS